MAPILIVEDNDINAEIISTTLEMYDIPNEVATSGDESVERCKLLPKDYFSLILMDIHMPGMSGYEAAKILKNELQIKAQIIAQTATHTTEETISQHSSYISDYIYKPFRPDELYSLIQKYI